jgi:hypothetical protein
MALPKLSHPTFELELPSTKQKIRYRPFLVKEEKILLIAQQSNDPQDMIFAIKQVLQNCSIDQVDVDSLTTFDIEYFFIKLRSKSINNVVTLRYRDLEDDNVYDFDVDLEELEVEYNPDHDMNVQVSDNTLLVLKYPRVSMLSAVKSENDTDFVFAVLRQCLDKLIKGKEEFSFEGETAEEIDDFILSLDVKSFNKIQTFLDTMPKIRHTIEYTNSLGNVRKIVLENLEDFFTLG